MKMQKMSFLILVAALFLTSVNVMAACAPQVPAKLAAAPYATLNAILTPAKVTSFRNKLNAVTIKLLMAHCSPKPMQQLL